MSEYSSQHPVPRLNRLGTENSYQDIIVPNIACLDGLYQM